MEVCEIRITFASMTIEQIEKQKREPRTYKVRDAYYDKARKRAKKEYTTLTQLIEVFVEMYADGGFGHIVFSNSKKMSAKSKK